MLNVDVQLQNTTCAVAQGDFDSAEVIGVQLNQEAQELNRMKDEFLATLSHELRTPLNAIVGWAHLLRDGKLDEEMRQRAIETINRNAKSQSQLIADILDVSRIVTGKLRLDLRPVELAPIVEATVDTMRPTAEAKGVALEAQLEDTAAQVSGDSDRLQQVVWNLVSNAIKFTPRGGVVRVKVSRERSHSTIVVEDNGAGMPPELIPRIFERFLQGDPTSTRFHGGLGLGRGQTIGSAEHGRAAGIPERAERAAEDDARLDVRPAERDADVVPQEDVRPLERNDAFPKCRLDVGEEPFDARRLVNDLDDDGQLLRD